MEVFHLSATLFRSMMKKTVDASIIAEASQNETPTISVVSSVEFAADTVPNVKRVSRAVNSRLRCFEIRFFMVLILIGNILKYILSFSSVTLYVVFFTHLNGPQGCISPVQGQQIFVFTVFNYFSTF